MKEFKHIRGFTLIELLTVIAIIGILAGIIIPTVAGARTSANKAKTKVQFGQWSSAVELFKQEYGFYPRLTAGNTIESGVIDTTTFLANLTGRDYLGAVVADGARKDNKRKLSFYSVADSELLKNASGTVTNQLVDAFGNASIHVMLDANGDGLISGAERLTAAVEAGNSIDGTKTPPAPDASSIPTQIRAGSAFYSAGKGSSSNDYVFSW